MGREKQRVPKGLGDTRLEGADGEEYTSCFTGETLCLEQPTLSLELGETHELHSIRRGGGGGNAGASHGC